LFSAKSSLLKDVLLSISLIFAFGGVTYAMHVRRNATAAVAIMKEKLDNLQKEMKILEEEEQWCVPIIQLLSYDFYVQVLYHFLTFVSFLKTYLSGYLIL